MNRITFTAGMSVKTWIKNFIATDVVPCFVVHSLKIKRTYLLFIFLSGLVRLSAQDSSQSYLQTRTMLSATGSTCLNQIAYYDGLGRLSQIVQKSVATSNQNLISLQEYDDMGRKSKNWLPIASTSDYLAPSTFISNAPGKRNNDSRPYSQVIYEASPLNRNVKEYGPGAAWYSAHPVSTEYLTNSSASPLNCINYTVTVSGGIANNGTYPSAQLEVTKVTDEDGNVSYSFKDRLERIILNRQMKGSISHDTYYIYDNYGNLCYVLQPMYQEVNNLSLYAFRYKYDGRNRCIEKTLPGADVIKYVYDLADNLVFSQDGNQRALSQWTFYLYDRFRRLTVKGVCSNTNASSASSQIITCTQANSNTGLGSSGYTSSFSLVSPVVHQVFYYDNYGFRSLTGFTDPAYFPASTVSAKGYLTGSVNVVFDSGIKLYSANYYDVGGRVVKSVVGNHLGKYETTNTTYTFTGKPLTVQHIHTASGKSTQTENYAYTYDQAERITQVRYTLNGNSVTLVSNTYNDYGQFSTRSLHGSASNKLTYQYNIRDWLTEIASSKFTQNLYYNTGSGTVLFNGNISSMTWKSGLESTVRGYKFTYDGLSRLTNAVYGEGSSISSNTNRFSENITGYDKNGNIKTLQRYGQTSSSAYGLIDNLTYTLNGNQLNRVDDAVTTSAYNNGFEFKNGASAANEYAYDANGNLTKDSNKGITLIQYNVLNLPSSITFSDGSSITHTYAADGTKLRTVHKIGSATTTTDYCGNVIYENNAAKLLLTEEGYVSLNDNKYHYYLKDHQGNNRVVVNQSGSVEETNYYYPFGGVFASTNNVQPYKYNGKELDSKKGLNWYDYGARYYDAALGRFATADRYSEKYSLLSPYQYGANNPLSNIDVNGDSIRVYAETTSNHGLGHAWLSVGENNDMVVYTYGRYNGTNKERGFNSLANGPGVLVRLVGEEAQLYNEKKQSETNMFVLTVSDVTDEQVAQVLDDKFNSSLIMPDNPRSEYYNDTSAHIIDEYNILWNNCATTVSTVLNAAGSNLFRGYMLQPANVMGMHRSVPVLKVYNTPLGIRNHLRGKSH